MITTICLFAAGFTFASWIGWEASSNYVDKFGILREPFALFPLGARSAVITAGTGAYLIIKRARQ